MSDSTITLIYHIGDRSITSPRGIMRRHRIVTAADMGIDKELFASLVAAKRIKKGPPPQAPKAEQKSSKPQDVKPEGKDLTPDSVLREDRILGAIRTMYNKDGSQKSADDFTNDGKPSCPALDVKVLEDGEKPITGPERDAAYALYEKEAAKNEQ